MSNKYTSRERLAGRRFRSRPAKGSLGGARLVVADGGIGHRCQSGRHAECRAHEIGCCACPCHNAAAGQG